MQPVADDQLVWSEFQLTASDYIDAAQLHYHYGWRGRLRRILIASAIIGLVFLMMSQTPRIGLIVFAISLPITSLFEQSWQQLRKKFEVPLAARRHFLSERINQVPYHIAQTAEGVHFKSQYGESHFPWNVYVGWQSNRDVTLLYSSLFGYHTLPKRDLGKTFSSTLEEALRREIGPPLDELTLQRLKKKKCTSLRDTI